MKPDSFVVTKIPQNFIYPEIKDEDYRFGSGELTGTPLRPDGDWRGYLPPEEDQNIRGIESSACYVEASQHAIATIEEEELGELDNNYSARFNALLSGGTPQGGDPLRGADSIRNDGLVPESLMPFGDTIKSWSDFHSFKDVVESVVRAAGKKYLEKKILGYDIVCERNQPVALKYQRLRNALKYSPCPVSVTAWYEHDGLYYKPEGLRDNHLVELVYIDEFNHPYVRDTYYPYLKKLEANFNFDFAMRWSVERRNPAQENLVLAWVKAFLKWFADGQLAPMPPFPTPPQTAPPAPSKREQLAQAAESWLGKDPTPKDQVPDEVACVESLAKIAGDLFPELRGLTYTPNLHTALRKSTKFKGTLTPTRGCIIVTPTEGKNVGHTGIFLSDTKIASNASATGLFTQNYTFDSWIKYFRDKKKLHSYLFEPR